MDSSENQPGSSENQPVGIGVLVDTIEKRSFPWWILTLQELSNKNILKIKAIWAPDLDNAQRIRKFYLDESIPIYSGFSVSEQNDENVEETDNTLSFMACPNNGISGLIVNLPSALHVKVIEILFRTTSFNKDIYSTSLPCLVPSELESLLKLHNKLSSTSISSLSCWGVCQPFVFEPAAAAILEILPELGIIQGGLLVASLVPLEFINSHQLNLPDKLKCACYTYMGFLRRILGEISSICAISDSEEDMIDNRYNELSKEFIDCSKDSSSYAGWINFTDGITCTLTLLPINTSVFEFRIWGTLGCASMVWVQEKRYFEIRRYQKHFEHPSLHISDGLSLSLLAWIANLIGNDNKYKQIFNEGIIGCALNAFIDLSLAHAFLTSYGISIGFKATKTLDD